MVPNISLEQSLWSTGYTHVAGIDEAGRGPLAGPLSAGAVVIHRKNQVVPFVKDSKYMTARAREKAFDEICASSSAYGVGLVSQEEIDELGMSRATHLAMERALQQLEASFHITLSYVIVDGSKTLPLEHYPSRRIKAGGLYHYSISAGSVLAKITRDRIMKEYAHTYPEYGFEHHMGYGTREHLQALEKYGPCPLHRRSFYPVQRVLEKLSIPK